MKKLLVSMIFVITTSLYLQAEVKINLRILPASVSSKDIALYWNKPEDYSLVKIYQVFCNDKLVGSTNKNNFRIEKLKPNSLYFICIKSVYDDGKSSTSNIVNVQTQAKPSIVNIKKFGAVGDAKTLNTKAIQAAIDACQPKGEVVIPSGIYMTGALFVQKSNITIRLEKGSVLMASHNLEDFPIIHTRYEGRIKEAYASVLNIGTLEKGVRFHDIRLVGEGVLDGQGSVLADLQTKARDRMARAHGLPIINCDNVCIEGITIQNPCTWNVHPIYCKGVTTNGVTILSDGMGLTNADGWDPDSSDSCYLLNSTLETHDDYIAIKSGVDEEGRAVGIPSRNIYVSFCHFKHGGGLAIGSEMSGGVQNVWFEDCKIENSDRGFHVKSRPGRGGIVENIHFRDIDVDHTGGWGISVDMWYYVENHIPFSRKIDEISTFRNITFENIHIKEASGNPIQIIGLEENPISDIIFRNITIDKSDFKVLLRNCKNISFENVKLGEKYWIRDHAENIYVDLLTSRPKRMNYNYVLVDDSATYATKALYANLRKTAANGRFLFGQQDATSSGYGWKDDSGRSDIQKITGKLPSFYSWDFMDFTRPNQDNTKDEAKIRKLTAKAFYNGGVNSYCWHFWNPITDSSFYDTSVRVIEKLLPGGSHHEKYKKILEGIAKYDKTLIGRYGEQIPIIFRPFHELDGSWFWWGANYCTPKEFKNLYRFTVSYLRDTLGVHNFIYAFSPDCKFSSEKEYLERYPGDEYVDIVAMDDYWDFRIERNKLDSAYVRLKILTDYAEKNGKLSALTETGQSKIENPKWFTDCLMKVLSRYPETLKLGYVAVWRNSVKGFYTPYIDHPAQQDFMDFCNDKRVIMGADKNLKGFYELQ